MNGKIRWAAFGLAMLLATANASAAEKDMNFYDFGIGLDFTSFCGLRLEGALSEPCRTFVGSVIEITEANNLSAPEYRDRVFPATCIPRGLKIEDIIEAIRPKLPTMCLGLCTATWYVMSGLAATFPCKS